MKKGKKNVKKTTKKKPEPTQEERRIEAISKMIDNHDIYERLTDASFIMYLYELKNKKVKECMEYLLKYFGDREKRYINDILKMSKGGSVGKKDSGNRSRK